MTIVNYIAQQILNDDEDDSERIRYDYEHATDLDKKAIDNFCISLCGWSLATIINENPPETVDTDTDL